MNLKTEKILHRGENRVRLDFPYNRTFAGILKREVNATWSKTLRAWHMADTPDNMIKIEKILADEVLVKDKRVEIHTDSTPQENTQKYDIQEIDPVSPIKKDIAIDVIGKKILLKMPKNDEDVKFVLALRYSRWNKLDFI